MIEISQKSAFVFSTAVNGTGYNFQIFAENQDAARKQLSAALRQIADELDTIKAGLKPS